MSHEPHHEFIFGCALAADLEAKVRSHFDVPNATSIAEHFGACPSPQFCVPLEDCYENRPDWQPDFERFYRDRDIKPGYTINRFGILHEQSSTHHFTHIVSPLANAESLEEILEFPFYTFREGSEEGFAAHVTEVKKAGGITSVWVGNIYERAWQIRGLEQFLIDMVDRPEFCNAILDRITSRNIRWAEVSAATGVDVIFTTDDVSGQHGMLFGVERWRDFIKPRHKAVIDAARKIKPDVHVKYHCDGNPADIVGELIEIGVDILNPCQPECMDLERLKSEYGNDIVFDGTIGTQSVMPRGTPEDVRAAVGHAKRTFGYDGALTIAPTHVLEPDVPPENVAAFYAACMEPM